MYNQKPLAGELIDYGNPLSQGLVGYWLMNEGTGNIYNLAQSFNHETSRVDVTWATGKFGSCNSFPGGAGDCIKCGTVNEQLKLLSTDWTCIVWLYPDSVTGSHAVCGAMEADTDGWWIYNGDGATRIYVDGSNIGSSANYVANQWQQMGITWEQHGPFNNIVSFYRNGIYDTQNTTFAKDIPDTVGRDFVIGVDPRDYSDYPWDGMICHMMIWRRVLSASEIAQIYREPFCIVRRRRRIIYDEMVGVAAIAPTSVIYGPLVGCLGGPV